MSNLFIYLETINEQNLTSYIKRTEATFLQWIDDLVKNSILNPATNFDLDDLDLFFWSIKQSISNIKPDGEELANKFIQSLLLKAIQRDPAFLTLKTEEHSFIPDDVRKDSDFLKKLKTFYYTSIIKDVVLFSIGPVLSTLGILALTGTFTIAPWLTILLISTGIVSSLLGLIPARHAIKFHQEMSIFNSKKQDNEEITPVIVDVDSLDINSL